MAWRNRKMPAGAGAYRPQDQYPIVATNDVHFLRKEDHDMHDVLICIGTNENWLPQNACAIPGSVFEISRGNAGGVQGLSGGRGKYVENCGTVQCYHQADSTSTEKYLDLARRTGRRAKNTCVKYAIRGWKNGTERNV